MNARRTRAQFQLAADTFDTWRDDVLTGQPPVLYPIGNSELARIEIGPKLVTLLGGAPGAGKTAFTMQAVVDALRLTPTLRALVCNIEMPPTVLLDRQLARLSGIDVTSIRYRRLGAEHADRLDRALHTLEAVADRLCFVRPPFDLSNVAAAADTFEADLIVLDYIQRIRPPGEHGDRRGSVDATMNFLRRFADADCAVIVVAAVGRTKDRQGRSSYDADGLNLASFRESSELEFGADDAFLLVRDRKHLGRVVLRHLKARHTEARDVFLDFDRPLQRFTPVIKVEDWQPESTPAKGSRKAAVNRSALRALWQTEAAANDGEDDDQESDAEAFGSEGGEL
jgi:replicative DNA helicase